MADKYINVDKLLLNLPNESYKGVLKRILIQAPAADVAEIRHAHWRDTGSGQECSLCKEIQYGYDNGRRYCQNCGAKMKEAET